MQTPVLRQLWRFALTPCIIYLRAVVLFSQVLFLWIETAVERVLRPRYEIRGKCKQRAACCQYLGIQVAKPLFRAQLFIAFLKRYYLWMWGFEFKGRDEDYLMFSCTHIGADGRCSVYWRRPGICRKYPRRGPYERPVFLPGCGFYAYDRLEKKVILPLSD